MIRSTQPTTPGSREGGDAHHHDCAATASHPTAERIDFLHTLTLGGIEQAIYVHGNNPRSPVLLFLHGGPGLPHMPFAHVNAELAHAFVVVHWDQRGAGKSYSPALTAAHLSIEQLVSDAHELILWLCQRFRKFQVVLVGHSWGSALGTIVAARYPQLVAAYVGIGQITNRRAAEKVRFRLALTLARQLHNHAATDALARLGPPPYRSAHDSNPLERWACRLSGDCHCPIANARFFRLALSSPIYSWLDLIRIPLGVRFSERCFWDEIVRKDDLFRQMPRLDIPTCFLVGRRDSVGSHFLALRYFDRLEAPRGKTFITFEHSGHWPHLDESHLFRTVLTGSVRAGCVADAIPMIGGRSARSDDESPSFSKAA